MGTKCALPVTPSAHYTCGGVTTDSQGRTTLKNLYAAGEAACTGLHGGNRLASTSLLEGLVYGASVADYVGRSRESLEVNELVKERFSSIFHSDLEGVLFDKYKEYKQSRDIDVERATQLLSDLKQLMWDHVGVVRTRLGLKRALMHIESMQEEAEYLFINSPCMETSGLRDAVLAGEAVTKAALSNSVSSGAHCIVLDTTSSTYFDTVSDQRDDDPKHVAIL